MANDYAGNFSLFYDKEWTGFTKDISNVLTAIASEFLRTTRGARFLDIGCGTGQLALAFLEEGYEVVGIDYSVSQLELAREKAKKYVENGMADFLQADAKELQMDTRFDLITAMYAFFNHVNITDRDIGTIFRRVESLLDDDGVFIFDLRSNIHKKMATEMTKGDGYTGFETTLVIETEGRREEITYNEGFVLTNPAEDIYKRYQHIHHMKFPEAPKIARQLAASGFVSFCFIEFRPGPNGPRVKLLDTPPKEHELTLVIASKTRTISALFEGLPDLINDLDHVWSYDSFFDQTHDGHPLQMLTSVRE